MPRRGTARRARPRRAAAGRQPGFFDRVYALVARVPAGRVVTYGQVAGLLGAPRAARIVGWAMHDNPHGAAVPCHRVVQRGGSLSPNYCLEDPQRQRRLLEREGVAFTLDGRVDLARHGWPGPDTISGSPSTHSPPRRGS